MYICRAGTFPPAKTALECPQYVTSCHTLPPKALLPEFSAHGVHLKEKKQGLTTGIFGSWCTFEREEETPQRSAEYGTLRHLRKEILYDEDTFCLLYGSI